MFYVSIAFVNNSAAFTLAFSKVLILFSAVPVLPIIISSAFPMRFSRGADRLAMQAAVFFLFDGLNCDVRSCILDSVYSVQFFEDFVQVFSFYDY